MSELNDLAPEAFPEMDCTTPGGRRDSASQVRAHVVGKAERAIRWYYAKRTVKRRLGSGLRITAIVMGGLGTVVPVIAGISGFSWLAAAWGSVLAALAGICIALDRLLGASTGWARYVTTALRLGHMLEDFELAWTSRRVCSPDGLTEDELQEAVAACQAFSRAVHAAVEAETQSWAREFGSALRDLERMAPAAAKAPVPGLVTSPTRPDAT